MSESVRIEWLEMTPADDQHMHLAPGLRAGIDQNGDIWAWAGLLHAKELSLVLAAEDSEPFIVDGDQEFLRVGWMRERLTLEQLDCDLLDMIEGQVRKCRLH